MLQSHLSDSENRVDKAAIFDTPGLTPRADGLWRAEMR